MRALLISQRPILSQVAAGLRGAFACVGVGSIAEAWSVAGRSPIDLILLDLSATGGQSFLAARAALPAAPFIVLSDAIDGEEVVGAIAGGAQEAVALGDLSSTPALARAARFAVARHRAAEALRTVESRYRVLVEHLPIAAYTCDADGSITYFNAKAAELWGREPRLDEPGEQYCGALAAYTLEGEPIARADSDVARALADGVGYNGGAILIGRPDGSRRTALAHANPIHDAQGRIVGAINVLVDVTEQHRTADGLRRKNELLQSIFDHAPVMVSCVAYGHPMFVNRKMEDVLGWTAADFASRDLIDDVSEDAAAARHTREFIARAEGQWGDFRLRTRDGRLRETTWMTTGVSDGTRISFGLDVTERRRAEAAERERAALRESMAAMDQVLGVVGHELRTPIAGLRATGEFLLGAGDRNTPEFGTFLAAMHAEATRMSDTVDHLLEAARLDSGRAKWNWGPVRLADVCREAADGIRPLLDASRVTLELDVAPDATLSGDAGAIRRLLVNFLTNARNHTPSGRIRLAARLVAGRDGGPRAELAVVDTGVGIDPALLGRLGEAFALNAGVVGDAHVRGSGLGLAICRGIAAAHGGRIRIASTPGRGTTVTASLRADLPAADGVAAVPIEVHPSAHADPTREAA